VCRATLLAFVAYWPLLGLSPRVQGHHPAHLLAHFDERSIPACAGPPKFAVWSNDDSEVYPRVCRATTCNVDSQLLY